MSQDTLDAFIDTLVTEETLVCIQCGHLLRSPIKLTEYGNMCGICYNLLEIKPKNCIENSVLQRILSQLKFPCKFQSNGCEQRIFYKEHENHINICDYSIKYCLMSDTTTCNCSWIGTKADFLNHFLRKHTKFIINEQNNSFFFKLDLIKNFTTICLLKGKNDKMFLMKCVINMELNNLGYIICNTDGDSYDKYKCTITHNGSDDPRSLSKNNNPDLISKFTLKPINVMYEKEQDLEVKIVLNSLKETTKNSEYVIVRIDIKSNYAEINVTLINTLECPICNNYMQAPIYQCETGHTICSKCKSRIDRCPSCRKQFRNTRNFALESLTTEVLYPCSNRDSGCKRSLLLKDITRHENHCIYKSRNLKQNIIVIRTENVIANLRQYRI